MLTTWWTGWNLLINIHIHLAHLVEVLLHRKSPRLLDEPPKPAINGEDKANDAATTANTMHNVSESTVMMDIPKMKATILAVVTGITTLQMSTGSLSDLRVI